MLSQADQTFCIGPIAVRAAWRVHFSVEPSVVFAVVESAPALAAGCTVVAKPSEVTPATATRFAELSGEAGFPPGVLNIVHGYGSEAGAALVQHPEVPTISFTGGTTTGRDLAVSCAKQFKRTSLELGGKNPFVVFADADLDRAATEAARAAFSNTGQICLCGSRILVESSVLPKFQEKLLAATAAMRVGDPAEETTHIGSLVSEPHYLKVKQAIEAAPGTVLCGGGRPNNLPIVAAMAGSLNRRS